MKLIELIELNKKLSTVKGLKGKELNYAIEINLVNLKNEIEILSKQEKEIMELTKEYTEKVQKLRTEAATVDGVVKTKDIIQNGQTIQIYDISPEKMVDLEKELTELNESNRQLFFQQQKEYVEFQTMLNEKESDFQLTKVEYKNVPDDISTEDFKLIFSLVNKKEV